MLGKGVIVLTLVAIESGDLKSEIENWTLHLFISFFFNEISSPSDEGERETRAFLAFLQSGGSADCPFKNIVNALKSFRFSFLTRTRNLFAG